MTKIDLTGKTALIVGGTGGLGSAIAASLQACGAAVTVTGTRNALADYDDAASGIDYVQANLTDPEAAASLSKQFTQLDILVCAQGITAWDGSEFQADGFARIIDINLNSIMRVCEACHPALAQNGGSIVMLNSIAFHKATIGLPAYSAAKAGLESLTRSLAESWGRKHIRVNGVAPGFVETNMTRAAMDDPSRRKAYLANVPLARFSTPEDVANVALFLASDLSSYVTGVTIPVDGGRLLR